MRTQNTPMDWQRVLIITGAALIVVGYAAVAAQKIPAVLSWMLEHREYASLGMIVSAHGVSLGFCWALWRHFALNWTWHQAFFG